jgi:cold shock CspA family protein
MSATDNNNNNSARLTGRVKWFNNKTGFGFITALTDSEGVKEGSDVFVHHSAIKVAQEQYRYLVQGEYIDFVLSKLTDAGASKHEYQAVDVSGVKGGKLICETRWESRASGATSGASRFKRSEEGAGASAGASSSSSSSGAAAEGGGWTKVSNSRKSSSSFVPRQGASEWRRGESSGRGRGRGGRGGNASSE